MLKEFASFVPPEGLKILLVLFLSFLIGLEREEHQSRETHYAFGGIRTFPLMGLLGYMLALISGDALLPLSIGFVVVGAFMLVSYVHKLKGSEKSGITTEISGLGTYLLGALVYREHFWIASTIVVASLLLLELKTGLEDLAEKLPQEEIVTFTKFLLLTVVLLPIAPNAEFTVFAINPFKTWLVVVAVSTVSYASYVLQKVTKDKGGVALAALLGGAYSSTVTTVVLAKRAARENRPHLFSGGILMASGVMYVRLAALVALFNPALAVKLIPAFGVLAAGALAGGWAWSRRPDGSEGVLKREYQAKNPLEIRAAFAFALVFLAVLVGSRLAVTYLGHAGVYTLSALMGVADVDPLILGMTQSAGASTPLGVAAASILIAAASNNVAKGVYAYSFADRPTGRQALGLLLLLGAAGLFPLFLVL